MNPMVKMILTVVVTGLVIGGGTYWYVNNKATTDKAALQSGIDGLNKTLADLEKPVSTTTTPSTTSSTYKKVTRGGDFSFEVPNTWSVFISGDIELPANKLSERKLAVGSTDVAVGDINWTQADFYFSSGDIAAKLVTDAKATDSTGWSQEKIGGLTADVRTFSLDNGQVTKGGTGGKTYYVSLKSKTVTVNATPVKTMVITKQAKGDTDFENAFSHLVSSFTFTK